MDLHDYEHALFRFICPPNRMRIGENRLKTGQNKMKYCNKSVIFLVLVIAVFCLSWISWLIFSWYSIYIEENYLKFSFSALTNSIHKLCWSFLNWWKCLSMSHVRLLVGIAWLFSELSTCMLFFFYPSFICSFWRADVLCLFQCASCPWNNILLNSRASLWNHLAEG